MTGKTFHPRSERPDRIELAAVGALIACAALLRFAGIGAQSLWFDEAFSRHVSSLSPGDVIGLLRSVDSHPPLYYLMLSYWVRLLGSSEAALRALGATLSTLAVGGTWWLGRRLGGPAVGVIAGLLMAVAPFQVQVAQDARMYALLGLLLLASWIALLSAAEGRRGAWVAYVIATVLTLYTHYYALFGLAGQVIYVLFGVPRARRSWLVSQALVLLLFLPWLPVLHDTVYRRGVLWLSFRPPVDWGTVTAVLGMLSFGGHAFGFAAYFRDASAPVLHQLAVLIPFVILLVAGLVFHRRVGPALWPLVGYAMVPVAAVLIFSLRYNVIYPRYFSFAQPAFALLLAGGMVWIGARVPSRHSRAALWGVVLILVLVNGWVLNEYHTNARLFKQDWRGAARLVSAQAGPTDVVVVLPWSAHLAFSYYFRGPHRVEFLTPAEIPSKPSQHFRFGPGADPGDRPFFRGLAERHEVLWLVSLGPYPREMGSRIGRATSGIYELAGYADFRGVEVRKLARVAAWRVERH